MKPSRLKKASDLSKSLHGRIVVRRGFILELDRGSLTWFDIVSKTLVQYFKASVNGVSPADRRDGDGDQSDLVSDNSSCDCGAITKVNQLRENPTKQDALINWVIFHFVR